MPLPKRDIDKQSEIQLQASLKEIFPEATKFDPIQDLSSPDPNIKFETAYEVKSENAALGLAVQATGPSYGGNATLLVGVDLHRSIAGVRVMALNDTPGLGMNASNPTYYVDKTKKLTFLGQFAGKFLTDPFEVKKMSWRSPPRRFLRRRSRTSSRQLAMLRSHIWTRRPWRPRRREVHRPKPVRPKAAPRPKPVRTEGLRRRREANEYEKTLFYF